MHRSSFSSYLGLIEEVSYSAQREHVKAFTSLNVFSCQVYTVSEGIKSENEGEGHVVFSLLLDSAAVYSIAPFSFIDILPTFRRFKNNSGEAFECVSFFLRDQTADATTGLFAQWDLFKQEVKNIATDYSSVKGFYDKYIMRVLSRSIHLLFELECDHPREFQQEITWFKCLPRVSPHTWCDCSCSVPTNFEWWTAVSPILEWLETSCEL